MQILTKMDPWVVDLLVDPIGKTPLARDGNEMISGYGRRYAFRSGVLDLRPFQFRRLSVQGITWAEGQRYYERWQGALSAQRHLPYCAELDSVREVYAAMPVVGRCLDVGGHQGRLRAFLDADQQYLIIDPFLEVFQGIEQQQGLLETYPFLSIPVNFICAMAEHLPVRESSFDTVHMRSVLDHFESPELAMTEAFRVLRPGGQLIIGLWVEGGRTGKQSLIELAKETIKASLPLIGLKRFADHHVWHPTYPELIELIKDSGFEVAQVHWQSQWRDHVCYVRAIKR